MIEIINIAYYRKEDWKRFVESVDDKESLHDTWEDWHLSFIKAKINLSIYDYIIKEVIIDVDKLKDYCRKKGLKNTSSTRAQYVLEYELAQN
ncbi:MAG: hypothetical protein ABIP79_10940 [Chitinophagaceae bacterium]